MDKIEKIIAEVGESKTLSQDSLDLLKELKDKVKCR